MPQISFSTDNKKASVNFDFPKLKLKTGERARIVVLVNKPDAEYVHNFRKPVIEGGKAVMETAKRRDGTEYKTNKMAFVRNPICRGDWATLEDKGSDPQNCPACAMAKDHPEWVQAPKRRFALHVIRYRTKSQSFSVTDPFAVETLVWSFPDRIFNKLSDFTEEVGDLKKVDLLLGPCENESFQKFDIAMGTKAEWAADDARKRLTVETLKGGLIPDLKVAIGNDQSEHYMKQDLEIIAEAWGEALGTNVEDEKSSQSLSEGLDDLFNDTQKDESKADPATATNSELDDWVPEDKAETSEPTTAASSGDDLLGDLLGSSDDEEPAQEEKKSAAPEADNFDDLLNSI